MEMTKKSIDRRVARTRTALHHALIALIRTKHYEAITIEEICDAANVGRSTFYAHYTGKDDLHRSGIENLRKVLANRHRGTPMDPADIGGRCLSFSLILFEHAQDHKDLFRALAGSRGGTLALAAIRQIVSDVVRNDLAATTDKASAYSPTDTMPREFIVQYVVGACMAVLTWWLDKGAKLPAHRVDAMFRRLATAGIASVI
jgi:AcrR family transcriptional regulator